MKLGLRTIITVPVGTGAPPSVLTPIGGAGLLIAFDNTPSLEYSPYVGTIYRLLLAYPALGTRRSASLSAASLIAIFLL